MVLGLLAPSPESVFAAESKGATYVIPIKGMIERGLLYAVRRGIEDAKQNNASAIIIDMDTPGGKLQSAEEIVFLLLNAGVPTYTYVNPDAISAGAIISFATDEIYMAPSGRIGDAMPIMMNPMPMGGAQAVPEDLKPKIMSPTLAMVRATTQAKGHDSDLAEAMVDPDLEYRIGDEVICAEGQLLTLTSQEAERRVGEEQRPLLSMGTVESLKALIEKLGLSGTEIVTVEITPAERIARAIEGFPLSGILMALGMLGLYIEFKTPGFGFPGIAGMILLAIWFWGHHLAGLAGTTELVLFILGVVLLAVEIFVIPGFGLTGIAGLLAIFLAIFSGMIELPSPNRPTFAPIDSQVQWAVLNMGLAFGLTFALAIMLSSVLPRTNAFHRILLENAVSSSEGYASSEEKPGLVGLTGKAVTPLHPSGIGLFDGKRLSVVARGSFIDANAPIVIAEAHGNRIVVDAVRGETSREQSA